MSDALDLANTLHQPSHVAAKLAGVEVEGAIQVNPAHAQFDKSVIQNPRCNPPSLNRLTDWMILLTILDVLPGVSALRVQVLHSQIFIDFPKDDWPNGCQQLAGPNMGAARP